ncbi:restriction endonuclease subunit S [Priestia megaterium]|uniref:restriction endonuclease subunit S n=1 Tax=Priestia megaterium TaxID=1404 RepID=UPI000BF990B5|nr:restriction endonuclease subunit S [Priestia megaterium]PFQ80874.1 hypothetical protein COK11_19750 [Priestia megaterium]
MKKMKPYEKYRETNIKWIGSIPYHWEIRKNSLLFKEVTDTNHTELELLSIMLDRGIVKQSTTGRRKRMSENNELYKKICVGDIGYNLMNAFMGSIGASKYEGIISPAYAVCRPKVELNPWYYHYLFRTPLYKSEFNKNSYGIMYERNRLYFDRFKRIFSFVPPLAEQNQIVKYLDYKVSQINKFISTKKRLITLIKEQRQAIIDEAVTKGINKTVRMRPSGIAWVGDIPEHWDIKRNKNLLTLRKETVGGSHSKYKLLSLTTNGIIERDLENGKGKFPSDFSTYQKVYINDLVFCLFDIDETPRTIGLSTLEGMITGAYTVFKVKSSRDYLYYYYLSLDQKKALKPLYTGLRKVISTDTFLRAKVPQPPVEEQYKIVEYIEKNIVRIDNTISYAQRQIDLITEYRDRLISDVVTGKMDVRHLKVEEMLEDSIDGDFAKLEEALEEQECEV